MKHLDVLLTAGLVLVFASCHIDQGIDPQLVVPTIRGKVVFQGEKPENTEWVVVVASREFPPTDPVELAETQSNYLNLSKDTVEYEIQLPNFGSYAAVGAVWKGKGEALALSDVLGIYGVSFVGLALPDTVTVTPANPVVENIDIVADYTRVNRGAAIKGRIHYSGTWPDDIEIMGIAAFAKRPQNLNEYLLYLMAINVPIPQKVRDFDYKLSVPPGTFEYIAVLSLPEGANFTDFEELGFFETARGSGIPGVVEVAKGDTLHGVDVFVDF